MWKEGSATGNISEQWTLLGHLNILHLLLLEGEPSILVVSKLVCFWLLRGCGRVLTSCILPTKQEVMAFCILHFVLVGLRPLKNSRLYVNGHCSIREVWVPTLSFQLHLSMPQNSIRPPPIWSAFFHMLVSELIVVQAWFSLFLKLPLSIPKSFCV